MQENVKAELQMMVNIGVLTSVSEPTEWVPSVVVNHKKNSEKIRLCIDPRDLNKACLRPHHPLRMVEEVTSQMPNSSVFSAIDAKHFWQISLDDKSSVLTKFNTQFGRFMPFRNSSASKGFQRPMEQIFVGYPCAIIMDDILVGGKDLRTKISGMCRIMHENLTSD